ncbi:hypothetical protein VTN77DRAFT_132 [Rasamsonia byssochlamydoides]|uniref:uncharacterized protein n=1 Tax=Rasamsonia byssochlamydoides TaxID=89139 RepID=UPI003743FF87
MAREESRQESSETDTATSSNVIYTPSTRTESITEQKPLLEESESESESPPHYEEITKPLSLEKGQRQNKWRNAVSRHRESKRSRARLVWALLKIAMFLGVLSFFITVLCLRKIVRSLSSRAMAFLGCLPVSQARQSSPPQGHCPPEYAVENSSAENASREIIVDKGSETIWGHWPLYDLLSLTTTTGAIAVSIEPQPADPKHPDKPARVVLQTVSGSIAVSFSSPRAASIPERDVKMADFTSNSSKEPEGSKKPSQRSSYAAGHNHGSDEFIPLPPRPYELEIKTESGLITGRFIFSTSASVVSQSGSIQALFIPVVFDGDNKSNAFLVTRTSTGSQHIELSEPVVVSSGNIHHSRLVASPEGKLSGYATSSHSTGSGSIQIAYPSSWAGTVHATTPRGGSICLDGPGLQVTKDGEGNAVGIKHPHRNEKGAEWWGSRGDMNVSVEMHGPGAINFYVRHRL